ncbi:MAG: hypothetical protein DRI79_03510, partial [Chloroflexi bacterium]
PRQFPESHHRSIPRRAPSELIERADLVTEMREVKHYYQQGVLARRPVRITSTCSGRWSRNASTSSTVSSPNQIATFTSSSTTMS